MATKTLDRISAASEKTGISPNILRRSIRLGMLPAYRVGDRGWFYVDPEQAGTLLRSVTPKPEAWTGGLLKKCHTVNDQRGDMREQG